MPKYLVIGVDNTASFAEIYQATSLDDAEEQANQDKSLNNPIVAAVLTVDDLKSYLAVMEEKDA